MRGRKITPGGFLGGASALALALFLSWTPFASAQDQSRLCSVAYPEHCKNCAALADIYKHADANTRTIRGRAVWTPLYAAYFKDCPDLAKRLLERGAHPSIGGGEGDLLATVVSWDRFEFDKHVAWVRLLVAKGASLDKPKINGKTPRQRLANMRPSETKDEIIEMIDAGM